MTEAVPLTARVADWVSSRRFEDLPEQAVRFARDAVIDCVGVALAGAAEPLGPVMLSTVSDVTRQGCHLFGTTRRASAADAALYNGTVAHALDYDDVNHPGYSHPGAHLIPTLFAL